MDTNPTQVEDDVRTALHSLYPESGVVTGGISLDLAQRPNRRWAHAAAIFASAAAILAISAAIVLSERGGDGSRQGPAGSLGTSRSGAVSTPSSILTSRVPLVSVPDWAAKCMPLQGTPAPQFVGLSRVNAAALAQRLRLGISRIATTGTCDSGEPNGLVEYLHPMVIAVDGRDVVVAAETYPPGTAGTPRG